METAQVWKSCFAEWPNALPRQGVLVTKLDEQIPFTTFLTSPSMLLLERKNPDTVGTRKVLIPYSEIGMLKIIDVVRMKEFMPLGFTGPALKEKEK